MAKSKLRDVAKCENCSICAKVSEVQKYNNISKLLDEIEPRDPNATIIFHYKYIINYKCLVCFFKTNSLNDWKCHIMSTFHLADCHKINNLYSDVCVRKECKVVLYGPQELLLEHKKSHLGLNAHPSNYNLTRMSSLMFEVMRRFIAKLKPLHYCSHCKKFAEKPIHNENIPVKINNPVKYYCKFCNVYFSSSSETIDYHFLTVEHMTLKCLFEFNIKARTNSKKIKLSEQSDKKKDPTTNYYDYLIQESIREPKLQGPNISTVVDSVKLPLILLSRYKNISQDIGECKLCSVKIKWNSLFMIQHLQCCKYKFSFLDFMITDLKNLAKTFECYACDYFSENIFGYKDHIISHSHIIKCLNSIIDNYSYFCSDCKIYMYSPKVSIINHLQLHNVTTTRFPLLSTSMKNIFKKLITNPNIVEIEHYYGDKPNAISKFSMQCYSCQINFHTTITDYLIHKITSEHIILKIIKPQTPLNKENDSLVTIKTQILKQDVPLIQEVTSIKVDHNENAQNNQVNKTVVDINEAQKSNINDVFDQSNKQEEYSMTEPNNCIQLKSTDTKQYEQYKKYFIYKMKLLNILRQYKDDVMNSLVYYCEICDFLCEDKSIWDKHSDDKHAASGCSRLTFFCSTCSMWIISNNALKHNRTVEHCVLLKFLRSSKLLEEDLIKKTVIMESNYNCLYEDLEKEEQTDMNNTQENIDDTKEILENHYSENYVVNNNDYRRLIENKPNTLMLQNNFENQIEHGIDNTNSSNALKLNEITPISSNPPNTSLIMLHETNKDMMNQKDICADTLKVKIEYPINMTFSNTLELGEITPISNNLPNTLSTMLHLGNEDVKKQELVNCVNVSSASVLSSVGINFSKEIVDPQKISLVSGETICSLDLPSSKMSKPITLKTNKFNDDYLFEDFITLGHKCSKNTSVKQVIKTEVFTQNETETIPKEFEKELQNKIVSISDETTESLTSVPKLFKNEQIDKFDKDKICEYCYIQRPNSLESLTTSKQEIEPQIIDDKPQN